MRASSGIAAAAFVLVACVHPSAEGVATSHGTANGGWLEHGTSLDARGRGFVLARPTDAARFGTPTLVSALTESAARVAQDFPGGAPLRVGDLSDPRGGRHSRHGSHQTGRDADVVFYALDATGHAIVGDGAFAYDLHGIARRVLPAEGDAAGSRFFDTARNWHFVRTLLAEERHLVQWIFCSRGVKARLLRHAVDHERDARVLARAAAVLHQPSRGRSHSDHFHVRVLCTAEERAFGCLDEAPVWPWLRAQVEKPAAAESTHADDAQLVGWLLDD